MEYLEGGVGMPDAWQRLWAPHRLGYIRGENRPLDSNDVPCPVSYTHLTLPTIYSV